MHVTGRSWTLLFLLLGAWSGRAWAAPPPAPTGGDERVRVRELEHGGRALELRRGPGWQERWRTAAPDEDGERGETLAWTIPRDGAGPAAVRLRWEEGRDLCGGGPLPLRPEVYDPAADRFEPLLRWLPPPSSSLTSPTVVDGPAPTTASPLAPALLVREGHLATGSDGAAAALTDGDPRSGWGRGPTSGPGDLLAVGWLEAETRPQTVLLRPQPGQALPAELWLLLASGRYRLSLAGVPADAVVQLPWPGEASAGQACLGLAIPAGVSGGLAEVVVGTQSDALPAGEALSRVAALVAQPTAAARAAAARLRGTGQPGLQALAALPAPTSADGWRRLGEAVAASGAAGAPSLLLDRCEGAANLSLLGPALLRLGDGACSELAARLSERAADSLVPLLGQLARWKDGLTRCRGPLVSALPRLLRPDASLNPFLLAVQLAGRLGEPGLAASLLPLGEHPDEQTRLATLAVLPILLPAGAEGLAAVPALLARALQDASPDVRRQALLTLARLTSAGTGARVGLTPALRAGVTALLGDPWPEVRVAAVLTLVAGEGAIVARPELLRAATDRDAQVGFTALRALTQAGAGPEVVEVAARIAGGAAEPIDNRLEAIHLLAGAGEAGRARLAALADGWRRAPADSPTEYLLLREAAPLLGWPLPVPPAEQPVPHQR